MPTSSITETIPSAPRGSAHGGSSLRAPRPQSYVQSSIEESRESANRAEEATLARLPVGVISVDKSYDIHSINPAARHLLSVHGPAVGEDLLHLVREAPYDELRTAIDYAFREGEPASTGEFEVEEVTTGESPILCMSCHPPDSPDSGEEDNGPDSREEVTILVEEVTGYARARRELQESWDSAKTELEELRRRYEEESGRNKKQNARLIEGNRQLEAANRDLRNTVEEQRASSEQYQLSAEEAQASAEEIETLNEELQATNEELETVNEELQATVEELNTTNEDLQNRSQELQKVSRERDQEQKRMQKQLQTQLRTLLESVPEPMLVVEPSGKDTLTNESYRRTFGPGGFVATHDLDDTGTGMSGADTPQERASRGESFTAELQATDAGGVKHRYEITGNPVGDEQQRGGLVVFREIPANPG